MSARTVVSMPQGEDRTPQRAFDFDGDPPYSAAVSVIVAALDDEGLCLSPMTVGGLRVRAIRMGAQTRYIVPGPRIWGKRS